MEQQHTWNEVKAIWNHSSEGTKINFEIHALIDELKEKISPFERDRITMDVQTLKNAWETDKQWVSDWEKESVQKDIVRIKSLLKKFLTWLKSNKK